MHHVYLALAVAAEAGWALSMKASPGLVIWSSWGAARTWGLYVLSLVFLSMASRRLEIGALYAVWAGLGAVIIASGGVVLFREQVTTMKVASIALIVAGVVGLNLPGR